MRSVHFNGSLPISVAKWQKTCTEVRYLHSTDETLPKGSGRKRDNFSNSCVIVDTVMVNVKEADNATAKHEALYQTKGDNKLYE